MGIESRGTAQLGSRICGLIRPAEWRGAARTSLRRRVHGDRSSMAGETGRLNALRQATAPQTLCCLIAILTTTSWATQIRTVGTIPATTLTLTGPCTERYALSNIR